jgi:hypothetical protein
MTSRAIEFAQAKLEELSQTSYEEVRCSASGVPCSEEEDPVSEDPLFRREVSIVYADPTNNFEEPTPDTTDTGLKKVGVTLYWTSNLGAGEKNITFYTFIVDK